MKIELQSVEWSNMFSYGENNRLDLNKHRLNQLDAINGSGKSSLALIIQEILFGKNVKGVKKTDIINRYINSKKWNGEICFSVNNEPYKVLVARSGASTKVNLYNGAKDISEHKVIDTYKKIVDILGVDFSVFSQLTYQSSTNALEFLRATDANRKRFLINLFNLEKYLEIGDIVKLKIGECESTIRDPRADLKSVNDFLNKTSIPEQKTLVDIPAIDDSMPVRISEIAKQLENYSQTCKTIDKNNMYKQELEGLEFDIAAQEPEPFPYTEEYQTLKLDISSLNLAIADLKKKLNNTDTTDTCSACGQSIDNSQQLKIKTDLEQQIKDKEATKTKALTKAKEWSDEVKDVQAAKEYYIENKTKIERFEQLTQLIDSSIPSSYPDVSQLEAEKAELTQQHNKAKLNQEKAITHNNQVSAHNAKVEALIEQKNDFIIRQKELENVINNLEQKLSALNTLKKAFSPTGIVAFKLENLTKELEETINYYLAELSDGQFQIEFLLEKEKLNISVIDNGLKSPIENVSSGEFNRIQTAILLAIKSLLSKISGSSINLLFLDEIMGVLDAEGKEKLVELIQKEDNLNTFLIAHDYDHPLIDKIQIKKENNISYIIN
jgi:DNA repair exonuclease SbcCD ATPase subunit